MQRLDEIMSQLNLEHLSQRERQELSNVIRRHDALFILDKHELGRITGDPVNIKVRDPQPGRSPMYRCPEQAKEIIAEMLLDMVKQEIIKISTAAWLSPIVLVNKPDGSKRMCLDYRHVNKHLAADVHPLPRLDELIEQTAGHQYYITLDMKDAYFQILLDEESRDLTTFSDGVTLYRFRRLPFGLNCSPAIFSCKMASLLNSLLKEGSFRNYLDNVILMAPDFDTFGGRLEQLFDLLAQNRVKLTLSKCSFALKEVTFIGHRISAEGSRPDPKNVESISSMKAPTSVKEVRRFLGMCVFYRKHVPLFAKIATPLSNLTKAQVKFSWTEACQQAFERLKRSLINPPILVKAQLDQPFINTTDDSNSHVGGVLSQIQDDNTNKPIGFFSKKQSLRDKIFRHGQRSDGGHLNVSSFSSLPLGNPVYRHY